jgi:nucleotide-binding universal stress UspA family protein
MYSRILVATDGSPLSQKAVESAVALAKLCNAELVALNVVDVYPQTYFEGGLTSQSEEVKRTEQQWLARGQAIVDTVRDSARSQGVQTTAITLTSDQVSDAILKTSEKYQCDVIVMASHGRRGIERLLLGSETQHVLTHTSLPVLILR